MTTPASNETRKLSFDSFVHIINGKARSSATTRHGLNPANREAKAEVPVATQQDLDDAVAAAKAAFKKWRRVPYEERKKAVVAYADAIDELRDEFRDLLISEQGKPVCDSSGRCNEIH
jgi:acyl-CoA reductase-like NAD-dependent aldehyde dehydrogenase